MIEPDWPIGVAFTSRTGMTTLYNLHPQTPQARKIEKIRDALRQGAVVLYPTDTVYAIGCDLNVKTAIERVRQLKQLSNDKPLTFSARRSLTLLTTPESATAPTALSNA